MNTFYLIDYENVRSEGLENIKSLSKEDHVIIFSTQNAINIRMDIAFSNKINVQGYTVPIGKQSLDMHLVSYLGYLLASHGKGYNYVIVSKDKDYDKIITFWKNEGYSHVSRKNQIETNNIVQNRSTVQPTPTKGKVAKRESKVRSFFGQHFKKKIYVDKKEEIINILLNAKNKQQVNNNLQKLYSDSNIVKQIYKIAQPLIDDLPGK